MAALWNKAGHYIFVLWFLLYSSFFFFPRLISAVADWMYTILPHIVWPLCKFKMHFWNVLHAARWKYRMQTIAKNLPSGHHRTTLTGYIFATKARIDNRKKIVKQQYLLHLSSQYGERRPTNGWDRFTSLGHPSKFQQVSHIGFVTAATSLTGDQRNFARCLAISLAGTRCIHFRGFLPRHLILPGAKFTLRRKLALSYFDRVTAQHSSSGRQPNFVAWSKEWNYGTVAPSHFQQMAPPIFRGRPSRWASAHILV